jgi:uncharacterized protein YndB with AHSA1/START domain
MSDNPNIGVRTMDLLFSTEIARPVDRVFAFLADMRNHPQEEETKVLRVDKTTSGPIGVGTRFREIVQMLPLVRVEMISEVTTYEPGERVAFTWRGGGMEGVLALSFRDQNGGTHLTLQETITPQGLMKLGGPLIHRSFTDTLQRRLEGLKTVLKLEAGGSSP